MVANKRVRRNEEIDARQLRVIGADGQMIGIISREQALEMARTQELDLVEVSPNAEPPVCKILDFGKFRYEETKKEHAARRKQKQIQIKEIKFRPGTEEGDYQRKLRDLTRFLVEGDKAKVTLRYRGREMAHQELGFKLLQRVQQDLQDFGAVEQMPKLEGRQLVMVIAPRKK